MLKRHKELRELSEEMKSILTEKGYMPKCGGHIGKTFGTMKIISYLKYKGIQMILSCNLCNKLYYTSKTEDNKQPRLTDCQCHNEGIDKLVRFSFHNKKIVKGENEYWCTGCKSYRGEHNRVGRYCDVCNYITKHKLTVYHTFEEIMDRWDSTTHKTCTKKLPYLSGTSAKGYKVAGFTYISSIDYAWCSKLLWIKVKDYVKATCSKYNCKRVDEPIKDLYGYYFLLHRYVLNMDKVNSLVGDHIYGFTLDNRRCNLRVCNNTENNYNSKKRKMGTSKYKGVDNIYRGKGKTWRVRLYLGEGKYKTRSYHTEEEAALGYNNLLDMYRPSEFNVYNKLD